MLNKLILASALTLALASTTAAFAQTDKYDGGDHMYSYAPTPPAAAPTRSSAVRHTEESRATPTATQTQWQSNVQYDGTSDHMHSFGPASK